MRPELERIAQIERYLNNEMDAGERAGFEGNLRMDPALREAMELQRDVMGGVSRGVLKKRIKHAGKRFHQRRLLRKSILSGVAGAVAVALCFWLLKPDAREHFASVESGYSGTALPALNEQGKAEWATADSLIPAQIFDIDAARDTVISTQSGMVMAIPAGSFIDDEGKRVEGRISICMKEAFDAATIMSAGLSTMADGRLLETGGMFFIDARNAGGVLKIDPEKPVYAEIPMTERDPDMMLFKGERKPDGSINWIDPKPLPKDLMTVDMASLDFYPREFLPTLAEKKYSTTDRRFTDSVYYSMAEWFGSERFSIAKDSIVTADTTAAVRYQRPDGFRTLADCGINPAHIKTLRAGGFNNTLIATKEFEQRLRLIHKTNSELFLNLYVRNLDRNLYEIDSMAAAVPESGYWEQFQAFAAQRLGKVRNGSKQFDMLRNFYREQSKLITETIARTQQQIRGQEASQDRIFQRRSEEQGRTDAKRASNMYAEEFWQNLNSTYKQLGFQRAPDLAFNENTGQIGIPSAMRTTVQVNIVSTGWHNIDKYAQYAQNVPMATRSRSSISYRDTANGTFSEIRYEPLNVSIADAATYDRILVYILPDKLSSFMRVNGSNGAFSEKLNMQFRNDLVCIGFKGTERFILSQKNIQPGTMTGLKLQASDSLGFLKQLRNAKDFGAAMNLVDDAAFEQYRLRYDADTRRRADWQAFMGILGKRLYPCLQRGGLNSGGFEADVNSDNAAIPDVEWMRGLPDLDGADQLERSRLQQAQDARLLPQSEKPATRAPQQ